MKKRAVIFGAGTYGQVYSKYLEEYYEILGYIDDNNLLNGTTVGQYSVLGNINFLFNSISKDVAVFVPIGNNTVRVNLLSKIASKGYEIPSFIHKTVIMDTTVELGKAIYILPSSNIMPFSKIQDYTMISMGVNIAHHVNIEKGCFFSQGVNIGASIYIKEYAYFGIGSTVMTGVSSVGKSALIGAGTLIIKNVPDEVVMIGNPGKILRTNVRK
jgi:sugar O-acyltransferase (sialic acid O-acetyltransferase NeuD family)